MKKTPKLAVAFALLLSSSFAFTPVSAVPYYCDCNWCSKSIYAYSKCQNPYSETSTTCSRFYSNYCLPL